MADTGLGKLRALGGGGRSGAEVGWLALEGFDGGGVREDVGIGGDVDFGAVEGAVAAAAHAVEERARERLACPFVRVKLHFFALEVAQGAGVAREADVGRERSEEHTSELQ